MNDRTLHAAVSALEPSFRPQGRSAGTFELGGHQVVLTLEPEGWLAASVPLAGPPEVLLERQAHIHGPAKVAAGPCLRAEWPVSRRLAEGCAALRVALHAGLAVLEEHGGSPPEVLGPRPEAAKVLETYAAEAPWAFSRDGDAWTFRVETPHLAQRTRATLEGGHVRFGAVLARLRHAHPNSRRALAHFLLDLNARLRLARGALGGDVAALEVVLPAKDLTTWLIEKAMGAVMVGTLAARRACVALVEHAVAEAYCTFHLERGGSS
jgi:hypothetical protein